MPVAGICFLPLRAAVAGVLTTTLFIVVVAMLPPGAGRATGDLAPPLAGDCGAGAADLTGVRGTGLPFGACNANHPDFMFTANQAPCMCTLQPAIPAAATVHWQTRSADTANANDALPTFTTTAPSERKCQSRSC